MHNNLLWICPWKVSDCCGNRVNRCENCYWPWIYIIYSIIIVMAFTFKWWFFMYTCFAWRITKTSWNHNARTRKENYIYNSKKETVLNAKYSMSLFCAMVVRPKMSHQLIIHPLSIFFMHASLLLRHARHTTNNKVSPWRMSYRREKVCSTTSPTWMVKGNRICLHVIPHTVRVVFAYIYIYICPCVSGWLCVHCKTFSKENLMVFTVTFSRASFWFCIE